MRFALSDEVLRYSPCVQAVEGAEEAGGDMELLDAQFERARMFAKIGDKNQAFAEYTAIVEKAKISTGKKIDAVMARTRVALFYLDTLEVSYCRPKTEQSVRRRIAHAYFVSSRGALPDRNPLCPQFQSQQVFADAL